MRYFLLVYWSFFIQIGYSQSRHYVRAEALGGSQNGKSWANAFIALQDALAAAQFGDTIWVAKGKYTPTYSLDRTESFMLKDGVKVFGGFSGTENTHSERNTTLYPAVLSGDIGVPDNSSDNSYHVLRGIGLSNTSELDGFVIQDANSYTETPPTAMDGYGGGLLLEGAPGVANSRPVIRNCIFRNNQAVYGGGIGITWNNADDSNSSTHYVNPIIETCRFEQNAALQAGGGIYKFGAIGQDTFWLRNCDFFRNHAFWDGGAGVAFNIPHFIARIALKNCNFDGDSTRTYGGGVQLLGVVFDNAEHNLLFENCSFRRCKSNPGGAIALSNTLGGGATGNKVRNNLRLINCVFENNEGPNRGDAIHVIARKGGEANVFVENCKFSDHTNGGSYVISVNAVQSSKVKLEVESSTFINNALQNTQNSFGIGVHGGLDFSTPTSEADIQVNNSLFYGNGGAVALTGSKNSRSITQVRNCTFVDNHNYVFIASWWPELAQNGGYNRFYLDNCVIWEPQAIKGTLFYNNQPQNLTMYDFFMDHCLINAFDTSGLPGAAAAFGNQVLWGQSPMFQDSLAADFRLSVCSPAMDSGNNLKADTLGADLDGLPRLRFGRVDMGAFEQQDTCAKVATNDFVSDNPETGLRLWPNPGTESAALNFAIPGAAGFPARVQLLALDGRVMYEQYQEIQMQNHLQLPSLPAGFYFLLVQSETRRWVAKWLR